MGQETLPYRLVDTFHGCLDEPRNPVFVFLPIWGGCVNWLRRRRSPGKKKGGAFVFRIFALKFFGAVKMAFLDCGDDLPSLPPSPRLCPQAENAGDTVVWLEKRRSRVYLAMVGRRAWRKAPMRQWARRLWTLTVNHHRRYDGNLLGMLDTIVKFFGRVS